MEVKRGYIDQNMVERRSDYHVSVNGREHVVSLGGAQNLIDGIPTNIEIKPIDADHGLYLLKNDRRSFFIVSEQTEDTINISAGHRFFQARVSKINKNHEVNKTRTGEEIVKAPMAGIVVSRLVETGELVETDQPLLIIESMKMHLQIKSHDNGRVNFFVGEGDQVGKDTPLFSLTS